MSMLEFSQCNPSPACPDGNCIGCKDGIINCQDPRCVGYCTNCIPNKTWERFGFGVYFVIILVIFLIIFVVWLTMGHQVAYYFVPNSDLEENGYMVKTTNQLSY